MVVGLAADPLVLSRRRRLRSGCARRATAEPAPPGPEADADHAEQRVLPYRPDQLYDLVAGVDRYPEFLPWCKAARITRREGEVFFADLVIAFKVFRERFSSKVTPIPKHKIDCRVHQRPVPLPQEPLAVSTPSRRRCLLDFYVDFEFQSKLLQNLIGLLFNEAVAPDGGGVREPGAPALHAGGSNERAADTVGRPAIV